MRVVSYNIQYSKGMDGCFDLQRTCAVIRGADIVCLQEVDQYWHRSGNVDQAAEISALMPTYYYVYGASFDVDASSATVHGTVSNRRRRHGNMILSRWPILSSRSFNLPKRHYGDKFNMQMGFIEAVVATAHGAMRVYSYHAGYLESEERQAQVRRFAEVFERSPREHGAWCGKSDIDGVDWHNGQPTPAMPERAIVCGDFNANIETEEYRLLLTETGLVDCWAVADPEQANVATWKSERGEDVRMQGKIDHILVTPDLAPAIAGVSIDHETEASDHKPIELRLTLA